MSERVRPEDPVPPGADPDAGAPTADGGGAQTFDTMRTVSMILEEGRRIHGALVTLLIEPALRSHLDEAAQAPETASASDDDADPAADDANTASDAEMLELLNGAQRFLLTHPLMAQTAFSSLVAEGRRFAETPEGAAWQAALEDSALVRRARQLWSATTLNVLEERRETVVPSAFLELLQWAAEAGEGDLERLVAKLAQPSRQDESAA